MAKERQIYSDFCEKLARLRSGESVDIGKETDKLFFMLESGTPLLSGRETKTPCSVLQDLRALYEERERRIEQRVVGCERTMSTESGAYYSLNCVLSLLKEFILPHQVESQLTRNLVNELYYLGLAYVYAICQATSDEYIDKDKVPSAKTTAIEVAKGSRRLRNSYLYKGFNEETRRNLHNLEKALEKTDPKLLREFTLTFIGPKEMMKKRQDTTEMVERVVGDYNPDIIIPIAHGGIEPALEISERYQERGIEIPAYPLMFSIRTRKQKEPWINSDEHFLESLPGKKILVVEDWITTGNTLRGILTALEQKFPKEIRVATIKRDPRSEEVSILKNYKIYSGIVAEYKGQNNDKVEPKE